MPKSIYESMHELQLMRQHVREMEGELQRRTDAATPLMPDDERKLVEYQSRADSVLREAGRFAQAPLPLERPAQYRRRLAESLKEFSPELKGCEFHRMDDATFGMFEEMAYEGARKNGKSFGLKPTEMRPIESKSVGGHARVDWAGGEKAWFGSTFARPARRAVFKSQGEYQAMERDANLARVSEVISAARRQTVQAPRAAF